MFALLLLLHLFQNIDDDILAAKGDWSLLHYVYIVQIQGIPKVSMRFEV